MTEPKSAPVYQFNLISLIQLYWKWRWHLLILAGLAILASAIFSGPMFITPKYKSNIIFYPTVNNSISNAFLSQKSGENSDPLMFGQESQAEEMLQILNSDLLKGAVIRRFDLLNHYHIDTTSIYKYAHLSRQYDANVKCHRTQYSSIEIEVFDEDPAFAAEMISGISSILDSLKTAIQRTVATQALSIVKAAYDQKQNEVQQLNDSLNILADMGVYNATEQAKMITDAISKGHNNVQQMQQNLAKYGRAYETLANKVRLEQEKLSDLQKKYEEAKIDAEETLTHKFEISRSGRSDIKAYPIRWLIVVVTTASTLAVAMIFFYIKDRVLPALKTNEPK